MADIYSKDKYWALLGIIGAFIVLYGITQSPPQPYYVVGAVALLATAIFYKLFYFITLELILIAGHISILLGIGPYIQAALPILLSLQLLIFSLMFSKDNKLFLVFGICGIALLSIGFAYKDQWIFFTGSFFIATYAYYSGYKGHYPAYIWAVLNTLFAALSLYSIFFL